MSRGFVFFAGSSWDSGADGVGIDAGVAGKGVFPSSDGVYQRFAGFGACPPCIAARITADGAVSPRCGLTGKGGSGEGPAPAAGVATVAANAVLLAIPPPPGAPGIGGKGDARVGVGLSG